MAIQKIKLDATMQEAIALINSNFNFLQSGQIETESGTWTPVLENCTYEFISNNSYYCKVGNLCFIQTYLTGTIKSLTGDKKARIRGLPFTVKGNASMTIGSFGRCVNNVTGLTASAQSNYIGIYWGNTDSYIGGNGCSWVVNNGNTFFISISGVYEIGE